LGFATLTTNLRAEQTTTIEFQIESQRNKKKIPEYHHHPAKGFFGKEFGGEPRTGSRKTEEKQKTPWGLKSRPPKPQTEQNR
jgi:hypothetical protein